MSRLPDSMVLRDGEKEVWVCRVEVHLTKTVSEHHFYLYLLQDLDRPHLVDGVAVAHEVPDTGHGGRAEQPHDPPGSSRGQDRLTSVHVIAPAGECDVIAPAGVGCRSSCRRVMS